MQPWLRRTIWHPALGLAILSEPLPHFKVWRVAGEIQDFGVLGLQVLIEKMHGCPCPWKRAFFVDHVRPVDPVAQDGFSSVSAKHHFSPLEHTTMTAWGSGSQLPTLVRVDECLLRQSELGGNA